MHVGLKNGIAWALIPQIVLVKVLGFFPTWVESWYSTGIYPHISKILRKCYGWIPFSVGDCLYGLLMVALAYYIIRNRRKIRYEWKGFLRDITMVLSIAYGCFHLLWGLNYYREPLFKILDIQEMDDFQELVHFTEKLIQKTNALQLQLTQDRTAAVEIPYSRDEIFHKTLEGYVQLGTRNPLYQYQNPSVKISLFSTLLSYMGYGGYLNPFTNEAQVNGHLPLFRFPVVAGHEIGHQLGYSAENETNFIGYLVTSQNTDPHFQYSAAAYALGYCLNDIRRKDKKRYTQMVETLHPGVKKNYEAVTAFWKKYENPAEPLFKAVYNGFLKANNQKEGLKSYSKIVTLLVGYHKQHPL